MSRTDTVSIVDVSLITICTESLLYGIVCVLFATSTYLHINRQRFNSRLQDPRPAINPSVPLKAIFSPFFIGSILLYAIVTAHWSINVYRLFQAFKLFNRGQTPAALYLDSSQTTHMVKSIFLFAEIVTGDAMLIYRLYIVWNSNPRAIVIPVLTFTGLVACGIGSELQVNHFEPGTEIIHSGLGRWIVADLIFTICTNVYCTVLIAYRIWTISTAAKESSGMNLMSISAIVVESAAIYTAWTVVYLAVYESHSTILFFVLDTLAQICAIGTFLINVRVSLGWAHKPSNDTTVSTPIKFRGETSRRHDPVSVSDGFELDTVQNQWPSKEGINKV